MRYVFIMLYLICFVAITTGIAQVPTDTIYFKSGKKVIGSILEQVPNKTVKINTINLGMKVYNFVDIKRIGSTPKEDLVKGTVYLKSGEVVKGIVLEKVYNKFIKIKTIRFGEMTYQDNEIDSIAEFVMLGDIERSIVFKNGEIINGYIIEEVPSKSIKLKTKNQEVQTFNFAEIEKILEAKKDNESTDSEIYLQNGQIIIGLITNRSANSVVVKTHKYGIFHYNSNQVLRIEEIKKPKPITNVEKKDSVIAKSKNDKFLNKTKEFINDSKKYFKIYDTNGIVVGGILLPDNIYYSLQLGIGITLFKKGKLSIAPELRCGVATNLDFNNTTLGISPLIINYQLFTKTKLEIGSDIYLRVYDEGSTTRVGIIAGASYAISPKLSLGFRSAVYNIPFIGLIGRYSF